MAKESHDFAEHWTKIALKSEDKISGVTYAAFHQFIHEQYPKQEEAAKHQPVAEPVSEESEDDDCEAEEKVEASNDVPEQVS